MFKTICLPSMEARRFVWLVVLRINVDLAIFQPFLDLEAGDNQSLKIQVARPGIEPRSSCSASQELNHSATAAPWKPVGDKNEILFIWLPPHNLAGDRHVVAAK